MGRPFRILGVQQIAVGSTSKDRLRRLWIDCLGLTIEGHYTSERENVDEDIAIAGRGAARCEVDLMQPLDARPQAGGARACAEPHRTVGRRPAAGRRMA